MDLVGVPVAVAAPPPAPSAGSPTGLDIVDGSCQTNMCQFTGQVVDNHGDQPGQGLMQVLIVRDDGAGGWERYGGQGAGTPAQTPGETVDLTFNLFQLQGDTLPATHTFCIAATFDPSVNGTDPTQTTDALYGPSNTVCLRATWVEQGAGSWQEIPPTEIDWHSFFPGCCVPAPVSAPPSTDCGDAAILAARGSGENSNGVSYPGARAVPIGTALHDQHGLSLFTFDEPSARTNGYEIGVTFPAVDLTPRRMDWPAYYASIDYGVEDLLFKVLTIRELCGDRFPVVLIGYSAGADVVQSALEQLDQRAGTGDTTWESVAGAVLMASPKFSPDDPTARGTYVGSYPLSGVRPGGKALVPARFTDVTRSYCLQDDPVCQFSLNNLRRNTGVHTRQYNVSSGSGRAIAADAVGLVLWDLEKAPTVRAVGELQAYRATPGNQVRVSAASVFANGAPTLQFLWDFTGDGRWDRTTTQPWTTYDYGTRLPGRLGQGPTAVTTRVRAVHADGTVTGRTICIRRAGNGRVTC